MKVRYLKLSKLDALKANIQGNLKRYECRTPWLEDFFADDAFTLDADVPGAGELELKLPDGSQDYDLENTKRVFTALKHLTRAQACDERLWVHMAHAPCWEYMRLRWPVEGKGGRGERGDPAAFVRERYFFMANRDRALVRNGIARLWWYGYVSYDPGREDPFELTGLLLHTLDITQNLLERSFSRNEGIARSVLRALAERRSRGIPMPDRATFRSAMRYLTLAGGVTVLDALDEQDIKELVLAKLGETVQATESTADGG